MGQHTAYISWKNPGGEFLKGRYSREHTWTFDGGLTIAASPSPSVIPTPWSNPANVDPEEALVASISSCHMLTFLWLASKAGLIVESYEDHSVGTMVKNERGVYWVNKVTLKPIIIWRGENIPDALKIENLHHKAHEECFIANSVKTEIVVEAN
jgi:organic hydroperoxide reductase OsmC/OhrA